MAYFLYFILIILSLFQDSKLAIYIGEFGRTPVGLISVAIFILLLLSLKNISLQYEHKMLIKLGIYLFIINIISLIVYIYIFNQPIEVLGENIALKSMKSSVYFYSILMYLVTIYNLQIRIKDIKKIFKPFIWSYFLLFFILIIELVDSSIISFLHIVPQYHRIRLTTMEASTTSTLIICFFIPTLYYYLYLYKNKFMRNISIVIFLVFTITSSSKGYLIGLILTIGVLILLINKIKLKIKIRVLLMGIIFGLLFFPTINQAIISDINKYTSIVTRLYTAYCSIIYSFKYPFGTGNAIYLVEFPNILKSQLWIFDKIDFKFNLLEIKTMIEQKTDKALTVKNAILQYNLYWGIIGSFGFIRFIYTIFKRIKKENDFNFGNKYIVLLYGYLFIIIMLFTTISFDIKYEIWAFVGLIIYLSNFNEKNNIKNNIKFNR